MDVRGRCCEFPKSRSAQKRQAQSPKTMQALQQSLAKSYIFAPLQVLDCFDAIVQTISQSQRLQATEILRLS